MNVRPEAGESLLETLIAVAILGLAVTAILGSIAAGITTSVVHRRQSDANTLLVSAAEELKNPATVGAGGNPYVTCAQASDYDPTRGLTIPTSWTVTLNSVQYWNGSDWRPRVPNGVITDAADTCLGADGTTPSSDDEWSGSEHLQKLHLTVAP